MINHNHILAFLLTGYSDGRYVNGHPEICRWLDENPEPHLYVIEQLPDELEVVGYHNVRIWSSVEARDDSIRRRATRTNESVTPSQPRVSVARAVTTEHPLVIQLYEAVEKQDLLQVVILKKQLRDSGIKFDRQKTDIRQIKGLPNI